MSGFLFHIIIKRTTAALALSMLVAVASAPAQAVAEEPPQLGAPGCLWPELSGQRLLQRQLGPITLANVAIRDVAKILVEKYGVPISFIEAAPDARLTLVQPQCTLQQLLDRIVTLAPGYRYGFIGPHLVLFSSDPKWRTRIEHLDQPGEPRFSATCDLVLRLRKLVPSLAQLQIPSLRGNPEAFVFADPVTFSGPAEVIELFTQLLGQRTSAVFFASTYEGQGPVVLRATAANLLESLDVSSPKAMLRQKGETVQIAVSGTLWNGVRQNLTSASCGTKYSTTSDMLRVSPDGLVTALGAGHEGVFVLYDNILKPLTVDVILNSSPKESRGAVR